MPEEEATPLSWLVIERGWRVERGDGEKLGTVDEVVADSEADIFSGLAVSTGLLSRPQFVPSERVTTIEAGVVRTDLRGDEELEPYEAESSVQVRPE